MSGKKIACFSNKKPKQKETSMRSKRLLFAILSTFYLLLAASVSPAAAPHIYFTAVPPTVGINNGLNYQFEILFSSAESDPHDLLVDFLDKDGWITGTRVTIPAGSHAVFPELKLQSSRSVDPASCYFSFKVIPQGGSWQQKLQEINLPVSIDNGTQIEERLFYADSVRLPLKQYVRPFYGYREGYHGQIWVGRSADDAEGHYQIKYQGQHWKYGFLRELRLDLNTGVIFGLMQCRSSSPEGCQKIHLASPLLTSDINPLYGSYLRMLRDEVASVMIGSRDMPHDTAMRPELAEAVTYLDAILALPGLTRE
jgi:hypothetical protein